MRGIICLVSITLLVMLAWWLKPCYVQPGVATLTSAPVKRAMKKMGPLYRYKLDDGKLYVHKDGQWLRLRY